MEPRMLPRAGFRFSPRWHMKRLMLGEVHASAEYVTSRAEAATVAHLPILQIVTL